jgi:hypothetical protein
VSGTDADAVAPTLLDLRDSFQVRLSRAEEEAHAILDAVLSEGSQAFITPVDLGLHNRELSTEADVEALVGEIRSRLLAQIRSGTRIRLR